MDYETAIKRMQNIRRRFRADQIRLSAEYLRVPTSEIRLSLAVLEGHLRGLDQAISVLEEERAADRLPGLSDA